MLGLALIAVVLTAWIAAVVLSAVLLAGSRSRAAADLAAIGGAQMLLSAGQEEVVCERVAKVAEDNGADLVDCVVSMTSTSERGASVEVVVEASTGLSVWPVVRARAHAGLVPDGV